MLHSRRLSPAAILIGFTLIGELALLAWLDLPALVELIPDDSFFYLVLARNLTATGEFTFDGAHPTYGFQPLWQLCLVPVALLARSSESLLYATLVLCSLLHVLSGACLHRLLLSLCGKVAALAGTAFWLVNPSIVRWFWGLKENGLYALLSILLLERCLRLLRGATGRRDAVVLGVLAGLAVLARVNFILLGGVLLLGLLVSGGRARTLLLAAACAVAVAAPWFAWSSWHFGSLLPTSGAVKFEAARQLAASMGTTWMSPAYCLRTLRALPAHLDQSLKLGAGLWGPLLVGAGAWTAALFGTSLWRSLAIDRAARRLLGLLLLLALVNSILNVLTLPAFLAYGQWYAVPEYVALAILFGVLAAAAHRQARASWAHLATLVGAIAVAGAAWSTIRERGWSSQFFDQQPPGTALHPNRALLAVGRWADRHLPVDVRVGAWDPGIVAYFSNRDVVSMDPLMNSPDYIDHLRFHPLVYVAEERLSYVLGPGPRRDGRYVFERLPPESYEVLWVPFPDSDLGWNPDEPWYYMLVRPSNSVGPDTLREEDVPFGSWRPNR